MLVDYARVRVTDLFACDLEFLLNPSLSFRCFGQALELRPAVGGDGHRRLHRVVACVEGVIVLLTGRDHWHGLGFLKHFES